MKIVVALLSLFFALMAIPCRSQPKIGVSSGIGYQDHFSVGLGLYAQRHAFSLHYGSNFFIHTNDFFACQIQYEYLFDKLTFWHFKPKTGIKSGYSVFTNQYYQWEITSLTTFAGIVRPLTEKTILAADFGVTYSRELSLKRKNFGEVGHYKTYLPEIKFSILFLLHPKAEEISKTIPAG